MCDAEAVLCSVPFQVSAYEPGPAAGPCPPAGLQAKFSALRRSGSSAGDDGLGGPWGGVLQVGLSPLMHDYPAPWRVVSQSSFAGTGNTALRFPSHW